jgi:hypothetical protein
MYKNICCSPIESNKWKLPKVEEAIKARVNFLVAKFSEELSTLIKKKRCLSSKLFRDVKPIALKNNKLENLSKDFSLYENDKGIDDNVKLP